MAISIDDLSSPPSGYGEYPVREAEVRWQDIVFSYNIMFPPGRASKAESQPLTWTANQGLSMSIKVHEVCWQVFASKKDLREVIWSGTLHWNLSQCSLDIAPLSYNNGGLSHILFPSGRAPSEQVREALIGAPPEEKWRMVEQMASLRGSALFFRGTRVYKQEPLSFRRNQHIKIQCAFPQPLKLKKTVRIRVNVTAKYSTAIEIG